METIEGRYDTYEKEDHCALAGGFDDFFAFRLRQKGSRRQVLAFRRYNDRGKGQRCKNHPVRGEASKACRLQNSRLFNENSGGLVCYCRRNRNVPRNPCNRPQEPHKSGVFPAQGSTAPSQ